MGIEERLERAARRAQSTGRVPALSVALRRDDRPLWTFQVGDAGPGKTLDDNTQFRLGSITKTFTMVLVMQCRDAGLLDLDDSVGEHLEGSGNRTIRDLLSHRSGIRREPANYDWESTEAPSVDKILGELTAAEQVLPPQRRFHYSNLAFAALGHLAARKRGGSWEEVLDEYILRPFGLKDTTVEARDTAATGYLVDYYTDHARAELGEPMGGAAPAGQLWSTPADASRWAAFLAHPESLDPDGKILAAATLAEARHPHIVRDEAKWNSAMGLGLMLENQGDRVYNVGHNGAMFGYLAAAFGRVGPDVPKGLGVATMGSSGTGGAAIDLAAELLRLSAEEDPADIPVWTIGEPAPAEYASILGRWWSEGFGFDFHWRDGVLLAQADGAPADLPPSVFAPDGPDRMRTVSGREAGELLELIRDDDGRVVKMYWATYPVLRERHTPLLGG